MENINLDKIIKPDELDYNMILSVPEEIGIKLQKIIQGNATETEKDSTNIQIIENSSEKLDLEESRKLIFRFNNHMLPITILDLPCIIEAQKTIDYKTFYKSSDISQMFFVHDFPYELGDEKELENFNPFRSGDKYFERLIWRKDPDHKYKLKHGLSKCTRNIRERRFKAKTKYNQEEILEVAKKLKSIIDNGAANFENQMKNMQESIQDDESVRYMDNQSIVASEKNLNIKNSNKFQNPNLNKNKYPQNSKVNICNQITNQTNRNFSINLNSLNNKESEIQSNKNTKKLNIKKPNNINHNNFAIPPSKRNISINNKNSNSNLSISLNLDIDNENRKDKNMKKKNSNFPLDTNNIILPLNEDNKLSFKNKFDDDNSDNDNFDTNLSPEFMKLKDEYMDLKESYNKIKNYLEINKNDSEEFREKEKLKRKLKKRIKQIKEIFKSKD